MEKAYVLQNKNFYPQEVDFKKLRSVINNIFLIFEIDNLDNNKYFKRSIFELYRLNFNIGIYLSNYNENIVSVKELIKNIRGFDIKLGVWTNDSVLYYKLLEFKNNFIIGIKDEYNQTQIIPRWEDNGDIENISLNTKLDFISDYLYEISLNNDFKTIYEENNLKPIPSTIYNYRKPIVTESELEFPKPKYYGDGILIGKREE